MAKEIKIELVIDEDQLKEIFESREIKYKKKYFAEIKEMLESDTSTLDEALEEEIDNIIADNYDE
jgi:hypothetical protein